MKETNRELPAIFFRLAVGGAVAALVLAGCGSGKPAAASTEQRYACRDAIAQQFEQDAMTGATGTRPAQCVGVSDRDITAFANQLLRGEYVFGDGKSVPLP